MHLRIHAIQGQEKGAGQAAAASAKWSRVSANASKLSKVFVIGYSDPRRPSELDHSTCFLR